MLTGKKFLIFLLLYWQLASNVIFLSFQGFGGCQKY